MKRLFFVLLGLTLLTGCDNRTEEERYHDYLEKQKQEKIWAILEQVFKIFLRMMKIRKKQFNM